MNLYPLKLKHACSTAIWGGNRLSDVWGKESNISPLAETWELACRDDGMMSRIENGEFAGLTLDEYIKAVGTAVVSDKYDGGRFPLLIKFIDAAADLSVQVHPDDGYASRVENDSGKTEMWYIVEAEPGAMIVCGLADGVGCEDFREAVRKNEYEKVLRYVEVKPGETYFIPSGLAHAIGKGILIAEIQQNSDLTYRIYDYGRLGADGKPRQLHVEQAMQVVRPFTDEEIGGIRYSRGEREGYLANSKYFAVFEAELEGTVEAFADKGSFQCVLSVSGEGEIAWDGGVYSFKKGDCIFVPAGMGSYTLRGVGKVLISTL